MNSLLEEEFLDPRDIADAARYEFKPGHRRGYLSLIWRVVHRKRFYFILGLFLAVGLLLYLRETGYLQIGTILPLLERYPVLAPALFIGFYAIMVVLLLPTLPMNIAAGFLWGTSLGCGFSVTAAVLGAACSFLIARYGVHGWLNRKFNRRQWRWLRLQIRKSDWQLLIFTRINPIFPFGPLNYFFGLTSVQFSKFLYMTVIGILPPSALIAAMGSTLGSVTLDHDSEALLKNIVVLSALLVLLVGIRVAAKYLARSRIQKSDTY